MNSSKQVEKPQRLSLHLHIAGSVGLSGKELLTGSHPCRLRPSSHALLLIHAPTSGCCSSSSRDRDSAHPCSGHAPTTTTTRSSAATPCSGAAPSTVTPWVGSEEDSGGGTHGLAQGLGISVGHRHSLSGVLHLTCLIC